MSRITHWRVYLAARVDTDNSGFLVVPDHIGKQLGEDISEGKRNVVPVVTGREPDIRSSRTLYLNLSQVVALEPRED